MDHDDVRRLLPADPNGAPRSPGWYAVGIGESRCGIVYVDDDGAAFGATFRADGLRYWDDHTAVDAITHHAPLPDCAAVHTDLDRALEQIDVANKRRRYFAAAMDRQHAALCADRDRAISENERLRDDVERVKCERDALAHRLRDVEASAAAMRKCLLDSVSAAAPDDDVALIRDTFPGSFASAMHAAAVAWARALLPDGRQDEVLAIGARRGDVRAALAPDAGRALLRELEALRARVGSIPNVDAREE